MSIKWQPGVVLKASMTIEPIELNKDFGTSLILKDDMSDLQKKVIDFFGEVSEEANQRIGQRRT